MLRIPNISRTKRPQLQHRHRQSLRVKLAASSAEIHLLADPEATSVVPLFHQSLVATPCKTTFYQLSVVPMWCDSLFQYNMLLASIGYNHHWPYWKLQGSPMNDIDAENRWVLLLLLSTRLCDGLQTPQHTGICGRLPIEIMEYICVARFHY